MLRLDTADVDLIFRAIHLADDNDDGDDGGADDDDNDDDDDDGDDGPLVRPFGLPLAPFGPSWAS